MNHCKKVDIENWSRREHYLYYKNQLKIEINVTAQVEIGQLLDFVHTHQRRFYPAFIYCTAKALNRIENFRMFTDKAGDLYVWDKIIPNYTIFHEDDLTFSDCWTDFCTDFAVFYERITQDMQTLKHTKGIKAKPGQPPNFFCISCAPWVSFTGMSSKAADKDPSFFPVVTAGKYEKKDTGTKIPVNITIAHAVCDGYHIGLFFEYLEEEIRSLSNTGRL